MVMHMTQAVFNSYFQKIEHLEYEQAVQGGYDDIHDCFSESVKNVHQRFGFSKNSITSPSGPLQNAIWKYSV